MSLFRKKKPAETTPPKPAAALQLIDKSEPHPQPSEEPLRKPEPNRRRSEILKLRLTREELDYINEQASLAQLSKTDYLLKAAQNHPAVVIDDIPALLIELRRQGNNLNQLTRLAHKTGSTELSRFDEVLQACEAAQKELKDLCAAWDIKLKEKK